MENKVVKYSGNHQEVYALILPQILSRTLKPRPQAGWFLIILGRDFIHNINRLFFAERFGAIKSPQLCQSSRVLLHVSVVGRLIGVKNLVNTYLFEVCDEIVKLAEGFLAKKELGLHFADVCSHVSSNCRN